MSKNKQSNADNDLIKAYTNMLERVKETLAHVDEKSLEEALEHAKETAAQLEEVTLEEAEQIATYVKRDLAHAAHYLQETGASLGSWFKFDWQLIEARFWQTFSQVADKTRLDMLQFNYRLKRGPAYRSGEVIGVGTLQCDNCGELVHFKRVSKIAACKQCGGEAFSVVKE